MEPWPRAFRRAFWHALWTLALLIFAAGTALAWISWRGGGSFGELALFASITAGLLGLPIAYRRHVPHAARWPATKRAWLLAIPLVFLLAVPVFLFVASGLRGALRD